MKSLALVAATMMLALMCAACSTEEAGETVGQEIADDYNAALNKAADVENQVLEQKNKMDEALREAENGREVP